MEAAATTRSMNTSMMCQRSASLTHLVHFLITHYSITNSAEINTPTNSLSYQGEDYMAIYETIDRKRAEAKEMKNKSASMEELETPTNSVKSFQMSSTRFAE